MGLAKDGSAAQRGNTILNVKELGQVFTPMDIVDQMLGLRKNKGTILEPSVGDGAFLSRLEESAIGVEIDPTLGNDNANRSRTIFGDFFSYSSNNKFDTIIGNPPYVRFQDIGDDTKHLLPMRMFDGRSNLYLFFIAKCVEHLNHRGELIFITPRDFLKATSARKLNALLYKAGSFTHYYELGDEPIFDGASPNCAIWRWEKGRKSRKVLTGGNFCFQGGQIWFGNYTIGHKKLGDYFDIKVGAVSGADDIFSSQEYGCTDMVCSTTAKDGKTRRVIYNRNDPSLKPYKERLINRRIRKFDDSNWWQWGRKFTQRPGARIYVNGKTRNENPFFISEIEAYDGSVLALFPRAKTDIKSAVKKLNATDWRALGFDCDGRKIFSQRSLSNAPIILP